MAVSQTITLAGGGSEVCVCPAAGTQVKVAVTAPWHLMLGKGKVRPAP